MKNKYEKIFNKEGDEEVDYRYELRKANIIVNNLVEQRNGVMNDLAIMKAEYTMISEELAIYKEEEEDNKKEITEEVNEWWDSIYYMIYYL